MKITVRFNGRVLNIEIADTATFADLRGALEQLCKVPVAAQRLLFAPPAAKRAKQRQAEREPERVLLCDAGLRSGSQLMLVGAPTVGALAERTQSADAGAMPPPTAPAAPGVTRDVYDRLQMRQVRRPEGRYQCNYPLGSTAMHTFSCTTCIALGVAKEGHVLCPACTVCCHGDHEVEPTGNRLRVRCDCCTVAFADVKDEAGAVVHAAPPCQFLIDPTTGRFPPERLEPTGNVTRGGGAMCSCKWHRNPPTLRCHHGSGEGIVEVPVRTADGECHLAPLGEDGLPDTAALDPKGTGAEANEEEGQDEEEEGDEDDEDDEDDATCCVLCGLQMWATHLTSVDTRWLCRHPCVPRASGFTTYFECRSCGVRCCIGCRIHCHRDCADVDMAPRYFDPESDDSSYTQCMCSAPRCRIKDDVPLEMAAAAEAAPGLFTTTPCWAKDTPLTGIPAADLTRDGFLEVVCAGCMQQYPWLMDAQGMAACLLGQPLPPPVPEPLPQSCRMVDDGVGGLRPLAERYPHHIGLLPWEILAFACQCPPCQSAYTTALPALRGLGQEEPCLEPSTKRCYGCSIEYEVTEEEPGYLCFTCASQAPNLLEMTFCAACQEDRSTRCRHDATHIFEPDTAATAWRIAGMGALERADPALQQAVMDNWQDAHGVVAELIAQNLERAKRLREHDGDSESTHSRSASANHP